MFVTAPFVPRIVTVLLDQVSEHQRDLTNSASLRFFNETAAMTARPTTKRAHETSQTLLKPSSLMARVRM